MPNIIGSYNQINYANLLAEGFGLDFNPISEVLLFTDGEEQCINVTVNNDRILEDEESFFLVLNTSDPRAFMFSQWTQINILDNDSMLNVSSKVPTHSLYSCSLVLI